jgi:hypothetical protein
VTAYRYPGHECKAAIELYPITGKKSVAAAKEAGFSASDIPALLVEGDNRPGLGYATAQAIADAGASMNFVVAQMIERKYSAVFGSKGGDRKEEVIKRHSSCVHAGGSLFILDARL